MALSSNGTKGGGAQWVADVPPFRVWHWEGAGAEGQKGPVREPQAVPADPDGGRTAVAAHVGAAGRPGAQRSTGGPHGLPDPSAVLLVESDAVTGLPSTGAMIARVGRLLGTGGAGWALLVGAIEVAISGTPGPSGAPDGILVSAAGALRANLRFDDPVARVGGATFVFAVPFLPGGTSAPQVAEHLRAAVVAAVTDRSDGTDGHGADAPGPDAPGPDAPDGPAGAGRGHEASRAAAGPVVRLASVVCSLPSTDEADGLLRSAVLALRARGCGEWFGRRGSDAVGATRGLMRASAGRSQAV